MITAPDDLRVQLAGLTTKALVSRAAALRPRAGNDPVRHATKTAIVTLARRVQTTNAEIAALDRQLEWLVRTTAPQLLEVYGVGVDTAAILLVAAGDNAARIRNEAGVGAPLRCRTHPRRLRQDQHAFVASTRAGTVKRTMRCGGVVLTRLGQGEPRTVAYMQRRLTEGRTKPEIIRSLKRYVAREIFQQLSDADATKQIRVAVTGLAQDCPDTLPGCPSSDLPSRHRHPRRTAWPNKSVPSRAGPSLVCQHRRASTP